MMTSHGIFFHFSEIFIYLAVRGVKGQKIVQGHVHKYEAAFGWGVDILMAVTFLSIVLFQKQNQKMI